MNALSDGDAVRSMRFAEADALAAAIEGADVEFEVMARSSADWHILRVNAAQSAFSSEEMAAPLTAAAAVEQGTISFVMGAAETDAWTFNGQAVDATSLMVLSNRAEWLLRTHSAINWMIFRVSHTAFARAFESASRRAFSFPDGAGLLKPSPAINGRIRESFKAVAALARTQPHALHAADTRARLEKVLLAPLIEAATGPDVVQTVRFRALASRTRDYLQAHKSAAVFPSDLCAELGVADRTLRRLFANVYGTSAARYLRLRRLNLARRALRDATGGGASVTEIGVRYGFFDLGRFAADYQALFGELPSSTLRKARSGIT